MGFLLIKCILLVAQNTRLYRKDTRNNNKEMTEDILQRRNDRSNKCIFM